MENTVTPQPSSEARTWAMLCHLGTFATFIPLGNLAVPFVIWLLKRDQYPLVADQGKEALNFQITMLIAWLVALILCVALIGFLFIWILPMCEIILTIVALVKVNENQAYRYPLTIRFIK